MTEERFERGEFGRMELGRRAFVRKLVVGAAFTVPVLASWDLVNSTMASGVTSNTGSGTGGSGTTGGTGGGTTTFTTNSSSSTSSGGGGGSGTTGGTGGVRQKKH